MHICKVHADVSHEWRMISRPGGAVVRAEVWYQLYGLSQQARFGGISSERPVWAETGGIDHEGHARWDQWVALKGVGKDDARVRFVRLYYVSSRAAHCIQTRTDYELCYV